MLRLNQPVQAHKATLVMVEDDAAIAEFMCTFIQVATPYQLVRFWNGQDALQHADEIIRMQPALFLFDYQLPTMTAVTLYDYLHALPELQHIPTIVFTAYNEMKVKDELKERDLPFLLKPFNLNDFLALLELYLPLPVKY